MIARMETLTPFLDLRKKSPKLRTNEHKFKQAHLQKQRAAL
jgi:hypothetical protein